MKAVYAGSFDPLTNGHIYIIMESLKLFEEVTILYATNKDKKRNTNLDQSIKELKKYLKDVNNVKIVSYNGLTAEYCKNHNIDYLVRGLRNTSDYLYEETIAKTNKEIFQELKTIYIRAENDIISSSMVREFYNYKKDISKYVPFIPLFEKDS